MASGDRSRALLAWFAVGMLGGAVDGVLTLRAAPTLAGGLADRLGTVGAAILVDALALLALATLAGVLAHLVAGRWAVGAWSSAITLAAAGALAYALAQRLEIKDGALSLAYLKVVGPAFAVAVVAAVLLAASFARGSWTVPSAASSCGIAFLALIGGFACAAGMGPAAGHAANDHRRPNLILISVDTLRADRLGAYGYSQPTSPELDRFAAGGTLFERTYVQSHWTLPSHAAMLTGIDPLAHGVLEIPNTLSPELHTLAERLAERGYRTAGFVGDSWYSYLGAGRHFDQGFETYEHAPHPGRFRRALLVRALDHLWTKVVERHVGMATNEIAAASRWLASDDGRPFFLFLHFYDVHSKGNDLPYESPAPWNLQFCPNGLGDYTGCDAAGNCSSHRLQQMERGKIPTQLFPGEVDLLSCLYDGGVAYIDHELGRLFANLDASGLAASTVVVVTSDHGEAFFEHGKPLHTTVYEEVIRVPLILRGPGIAVGKRIAGIARSIDLVPTLLELAGAPAAAPLQGRSLVPFLAADGPAQAFGDSFTVGSNKSDLLALVRGTQKEIVSRARFESGTRSEASLFFDLASDPGEKQNLLDSIDPALLALFDTELADRVTASRIVRQELFGASAPGTMTISEDEKKRLRALGYLQ